MLVFPALLAFALTLPPSAGIVAGIAAESDTAPQKEATGLTEENLAALRAFADAGDFAGALRLVAGLLPDTQPESYEHAFLSQIRGQTLVSLNRYDEAIAPLERSLALGDRHAWFTTEITLNTLRALNQIYLEKAAESDDAGERRHYHNLAGDRMERWVALLPNPTADDRLHAATILYTAATLDPEKPDLEKIRRAKDQAGASLLLRDKPDEQTLAFIVLILQQLGQRRESADILEILAAMKPETAVYWQQLFATYTTLAGAPGLPPSETRRLQLRALLTLERARALGFFSTPQDSFNIVALHYALGQHARAARILERGLADGSIDGTRSNWELLAGAWQQQHDTARAIEALTRAAAALPDDGEIEYSLARLCYAGDRLAETHAHLRAAVERGRLAHPGQTWLFLAYVAYELGACEEAARHAETAAMHPDTPKEDLARLSQAIQDALAKKPRPGNPRA
ncbi:MAG: hypothetical protein LBM04_13495, partial [Opitutaceae bacterium]|nr:hypothetical protein [Opitutaceae bacterium]